MFVKGMTYDLASLVLNLLGLLFADNLAVTFGGKLRGYNVSRTIITIDHEV